MEKKLIQQLNDTTAFIKTKYDKQPVIGVVLGSGLGNFVQEMQVECEIDYSELPHFPVSTVMGHSGKLIFGKLAYKDVVVMAGRFHYYEGYTTQQVAYPIRVMKMLGVQTLLISNAAGGVNTNFKVGDMMIINDHISLFTVNPLLGKNDEEIGTRFPDMSEPYDKTMIKQAKEIAAKNNFRCHVGVYAAVTGPTYETRAEYKYIHTIGADAVGMSTV